jgi:pimeloyl-ACP methyl ester carboxylesterase
MNKPIEAGRKAVNGVELHYEIHGDGTPLVMLHGGVNPADFFGAPLRAMAQNHRVIAIHLRGHGLSSDSEADWSYELMADDVDKLLAAIGIDRPDIMGWSLGGGVALQLAIRHPDRVGKLIVIGMNVKASGDFPEVRAAFDQMPEQAAEIAAHIATTPMAVMYPDIDWEVMMRRTGEMNQGDYDWSEDVARITAPTLLMFADAEMMYLEHIVEIYRLFGGGTRDAGVDGALRPTRNQLAIIPGTTHYDLALKETKVVTDFAKAFLAN